MHHLAKLGEQRMLLGDLREEVLQANLELVRRGVVVFTFGNVSGISRKDGLVAIKPSGVPYEELTAEQIVVCDLDGRVVESNLRPSSDLPTHIELYKHFPNIGGVAHTHSEYGTGLGAGEAGDPLLRHDPCRLFPWTDPGHAGHDGGGDRRRIREGDGRGDRADLRRLDPDHLPGVLVAGHAPFCWGKNAGDAVHNAAIVEYIAKMATHTLAINADAGPLPARAARQAFLPQARPRRLLRAEHQMTDGQMSREQQARLSSGATCP